MGPLGFEWLYFTFVCLVDFKPLMNLEVNSQRRISYNPRCGSPRVGVALFYLGLLFGIAWFSALEGILLVVLLSLKVNDPSGQKNLLICAVSTGNFLPFWR